MGYATKVGIGALMGSPGASVHCRGRTSTVGTGASLMGSATKVPTKVGTGALMPSPGASVHCRGERTSAVGTGSSPMGYATKVPTKLGTAVLMGSPTGASVHCRGERKSSEPLRTGVARPRADRRPKAGRRLRLCMTVQVMFDASL